MYVVIIGSGNVATVIGKLLFNKGINIAQVYSKTLAHAQILAHAIKAKPVDRIDAITKDASLYIIAVADNAIGTITNRLSLPGKLIVHTSGATSKEVLSGVSSRYGVMWPLQSIRKEADHLPVIPFVIDGCNEVVTNDIKTFALQLSGKVIVANDTARVQLHLSAVMVSNFSNHLYKLVFDYCHNNVLDFSLLLPLITETVQRLQTMPPYQSQTGPAVRNDTATMEQHLSMLNNNPELKEIYRLFSDSIVHHHADKD